MRDWPSYTFVGGHTVLDFLNTGGGNTKARDIERLTSYEDLLSWSAAAGIIDGNEVEALAGAAEDAPDSAAHCLNELTSQRERLYRYILAAIDGRPIPELDRRQIESSFHHAAGRAQLVASSPPLAAWQVGLKNAGLSLVKLRLDLAASVLVTGAASAHICQCEKCSWLFLDTSASKRRRWCSMAVCGNRAKGQRHYHRNRASQKQRDV
jgi:predicted RNA-binding Zn ribbon-like protein